MVVYQIPRTFLMSYGKSGRPYMSFDQFNNLVRLYRDDFYASQHVEGFIYDIGVRYNFWTVDTVNRYYRNMFFDQVLGEVSISFEIPDVDKHATIPLKIAIFDADGTYFTQEQRVTVELIGESGPALCSWRKVDTVREFVLDEAVRNAQG